MPRLPPNLAPGMYRVKKGSINKNIYFFKSPLFRYANKMSKKTEWEKSKYYYFEFSRSGFPRKLYYCTYHNSSFFSQKKPPLF